MKTKTANKKGTRKPTKKALSIVTLSSPTDVLGSYTGTPSRRKDKPTQDADDL